MELSTWEKVGFSAALVFLCSILLDQPVHVRCMIKWIPVVCFYGALRMQPGLRVGSVEARSRTWIAVGLVFGALADIVIEVHGVKNCFLAGVGLFWIEHVCYIAALLPTAKLRAGPLLPLTLWTGSMAYMMWLFAPDMRLFILPYIGVIMVMMYLALCQDESDLYGSRMGTEIVRNHRRMAVGAVVFGISDTLIAIRKFLLIPFLHRGFASGQILDVFEDMGLSERSIVVLIQLTIMVTYWSAQFLIARSAYWRRLKTEKDQV